MKIAITGASGFIGSRLTTYLSERGHSINALLRDPKRKPSFKSNKISLFYGDVTDKSSLYSAFKDADIVIHLAALFNRPGSSWKEYYDVNVQGSVNVLEASQSSSVKKVIHCSTGGVVSNNPYFPHSEDLPYSVPETDKYEKTKCEGEKAVRSYSQKYSYPVVVIRPAQPYGPGDMSKVKFYKLVNKGIIFNPGKTKKHLIYIDDLCRAFEIALNDKRAIGEIFHIGGKNSILLKDLIRLVAAQLEVSFPRVILPARPMAWTCSLVEFSCNLLGVKPILFRRSMDFFLKSVEFDISKAKRLLDFESLIDIPTGVKNTASWYREHNLI